MLESILMSPIMLWIGVHLAYLIGIVVLLAIGWGWMSGGDLSSDDRRRRDDDDDEWWWQQQIQQQEREHHHW